MRVRVTKVNEKTSKGLLFGADVYFTYCIEAAFMQALYHNMHVAAPAGRLWRMSAQNKK